MLDVNSVSSSSFAILPVETSKEFPWFSAQEKRFDEIRVFRYDDVLFFDGEVVDDPIPGVIAARKVKSVNRFKSCLSELSSQPSWKLRVNEELHADTGSMRLIWLRRLAKSSAARMSSRSRSS